MEILYFYIKIIKSLRKRKISRRKKGFVAYANVFWDKLNC